MDSMHSGLFVPGTQGPAKVQLLRTVLAVPGACSRQQIPGKEQEWELRLCVSWAGLAGPWLCFTPGVTLCFPRSKRELMWLHIPGIAPQLLPGLNSGSAAGSDCSSASHPCAFNLFCCKQRLGWVGFLPPTPFPFPAGLLWGGGCCGPGFSQLWLWV